MTLLRCAVLTSAAACLLSAPFGRADTPSIRIMPVGDSITDGTPVPGGYRAPLYVALTNAGYNVDYVGTQTVNPAPAVMPDADHEGRSGWTIDGIRNYIKSWFEAIQDPHVILVHIGTNDASNDPAYSNAVTRLNALVTTMATCQPSAHIIVTSLMKRSDASYNGITNYFNPHIPGLVSDQSAFDRRVTFLDMHAYLELSDMADGLHPNAGGYAKMAAAWFTAITNVIAADAVTPNQPAMIRATGAEDHAHVTITLNKTVTADTATNAANYALSSGTVMAAALSEDRRTLTLTTSAQTAGALYTVTVNNVTDDDAQTFATDSQITFKAVTPRGYLNNVPEASDYRLIYTLDIPDTVGFLSSAVPYTLNDAWADEIPTRVAYYMELQASGGDLQYVWVSMDAFTNREDKLGVPTVASGAIYQQYVTNLNVFCNVAGVTTGTVINTGNLEFWPSDYAETNITGVAGASSTTYDFGDSRTSVGTYGCMQVHNYGAGQTLFGFSGWGGTGGNTCIGIGNNPSGHPDWTHTFNGTGYAVKTLQVLVLPGAPVPPTLVSATSGLSHNYVDITFGKPVDAASATNIENYLISSGIKIFGATLSANQRTVTLATSPQTAGTVYTVTVNNVTDQTIPVALAIAVDSQITFLAPTPRGYLNNVAESSAYALVYSVDLPNSADYYRNKVGYSVDNSALVGPFRRVAYYMELQKPGGDLQYLWASMNAFTTDAGKLGVPTVIAGVLYKQTVDNMNVFCNVPGVVNGTSIATGNLEFWPSNYAPENGTGFPGANGGAFDFDDSGYGYSNGHGCMQLHNHGAGQTLFALNNWGGNDNAGNMGVGIGNNTDFSRSGTPYPDWTFSQNADTYTVKTLQVLVLQDPTVDTTPPAIVSAQAGAAGTLVTVVFDEKLAATSVDGTRFALDNGVTVLSATLFRDGKTVRLTTTPLPAGSALTLTVNGIRDLCANTIPAGTTASVAAAALPPSLVANAGGLADGFKVVYAYDIPVTGDFNGSTASTLCDQSDLAGSFDRVAYYVELVLPTGWTQYLWAAMDPFATNAKQLGVPTFASGEIYQQYVSNLDVRSNVGGIVNGTGMSGGNLEFWPKDYSEGNAIGIINANGLTLDFGDTIASYGGSYGCMQIHNSGASQTLFAMNNLGGDGRTLDIGIGNQAANQPDWTFANNAGVYVRRTLYVLVHPKTASDLPPAIVANAGPLANGFRRVYTLDIPVTGNFNGSLSAYTHISSRPSEAFDRIAYYAELVTSGGATQYVWAAMNAFTADETKIAVPTFASGEVYQQVVTNLDVASNVGGIVTGTGMTGGNIEFWPSNYGTANAIGIDNADGLAYDFGDSRDTGGGYGCMQIHNSGASQTLFAMNNFGGDGGTLCIGIGNNPGGSPDWTFAENAGNYTSRKLHILVHPTPVPAADPLRAPAEVTASVPEAAEWQLAYIIDLPVNGDFYNNAAAFNTVNNVTNGLTTSFSRIAYYLALQPNSGPAQYIWTAMDAFTADASRIGVPVGGTFFQQRLTRLDVKSNVGGIVAGTGLDTGNIEFWPSNYGQANAAGIPGANGSSYDFGDSGDGAWSGHGSMQVHNYGASQTLFAINRFNDPNNPLAIGIGNDPSNAAGPDWTFTYNAGDYSSRLLYVFVLPGGDSDVTRPSIYTAVPSKTLNRVAVTFSEALADSAANAAFFTLNNGPHATGASLSADKRTVLLDTTPLSAAQTYTLWVTGVRDRSVNGNLVIAGSSTTFTTFAAALPAVLSNVPEAADYELIYKLPVVNAVDYSYAGCLYSIDESLYPKPFPFDRVAYCMELSANGSSTNWVYVSMDAYTADLTKIGVPTAPRGAAFKTYVGNMNVYASAGANVTTGAGITTGLIEFWPSNYGMGRSFGLPNASDSAFDFDDNDFSTAPGHGSMQIHNYAAAQTIFAFNQFSGWRVPALGIGNQASAVDPDWTFTSNADSYAVKNIYVLARRGETPPGIVSGTLPVVWTQPASVEVLSGKPAQLNAYASGATSYQWRRNGVWIPGATKSWLTIDPTAYSDSGVYDVLAFGSGSAYATSQSATLTVRPYGTVLKLR